MNTVDESRIKSVQARSILNSHVQFVTEYIVELEGGGLGIGSAPSGETTSIYERDGADPKVERILDLIRTDGLYGISLNQEKFDSYLLRRSQDFGRLHSYALSVAFFSACRPKKDSSSRSSCPERRGVMPNICLNILNGGHHAYTNPVLSDFSEFILVSKSSNLHEIIDEHNEIQAIVKERLAYSDKMIVNGNPVNRMKVVDNRVWFDFLFEILEEQQLSDKYDLMIDASAGDLLKDGRYQFVVTDGSVRTTAEMLEYWQGLIHNYRLKFLEDPFQEKDYDGWAGLVRAEPSCAIIGDNLYSSNPQRIDDGIKKLYSTGLIIKPDQAGTVTTTFEAIKIAKKHNQTVITSHRSISTESVLLSWVTALCDIRYIKIGPLATDYSSILRLNELIRLLG